MYVVVLLRVMCTGTEVDKVLNSARFSGSLGTEKIDEI